MYTTQDYIDSLYNDRANIVKNLNEKGVEASLPYYIERD